MLAISLEEVRANLLSTGYPPERLHFVKGMVERTLPDAAPQQVALLRLDTDWYASTKHELEHLFPRIARNGVLIIDDYGHYVGARQAVDEYIEQHRLPLLLNRIDYTARLAVKTCDDRHDTPGPNHAQEARGMYHRLRSLLSQ